MDKIKKLSSSFSVSPQISKEDIAGLAERGFTSVINNRPDGEAMGQPSSHSLVDEARRYGLEYRYIPIVPGQIEDRDVEAFRKALNELKGPILAFCRSGQRSASLWALSEAQSQTPDDVLKVAAQAGFDLSAMRARLDIQSITNQKQAQASVAASLHDVIIVGGGAAGIAAASSLLKRNSQLNIVIVEPSDTHNYQPGWTLVGAGVMKSKDTFRRMSDLMPKSVQWVRESVIEFAPAHNQVVLSDGTRLAYSVLIVAPGLRLNWNAIEGLPETLGQNGVTSNYQPGLAPYTFQLVQGLESGPVLFTQPPMPIKCAGAPQKAMYLSCDTWRRGDKLDDIHVEFHTAGDVLFGVKEFVPPLMKYVDRYGIDLKLKSNLVKVDGPAKRAWFDVVTAEGGHDLVEKPFEMMHVCPPQVAPEFVIQSDLSDAAGWLAVNQETLQHERYENVFGLGDVISAPNAKTAAAVRKQAPIVAENTLAILQGCVPTVVYDGYGSCPLVVERGRVIMAEFGYGGKLTPTFPLDPTVPRWSMWVAKAHLMPYLYFDLMLKGREWLAVPKSRSR